MTHPQDVAVLSLPEILLAALQSGIAHNNGAGGQYLLCATESQLLRFGAKLADRAAGRASAEPEGFVLVPREPTEAMAYEAMDVHIDSGDGVIGLDHAEVLEVWSAMLAAAPTPTASIAPPKPWGTGLLAREELANDGHIGAGPSADAAPKAEGEAVAWVDFRNLASARVSRERGGPFDAHVWSESKTPIHDTPLYTAPSKELTHDQALALWGLGDMPFGDFCERVGRILGAPIASPVAQAAAGALSDEQCATQLALMKTPPMKDGAALHDWACDVMRAGYRLARPEADADRASGGVSQAARDVLAERARQVSAEGWTPEHDDEHREGELCYAAAGYCCAASDALQAIEHEMDGDGEPTLEDPATLLKGRPWPHGWDFKPAPPRRQIVKAGALILAEIERLDRAIPTTKD